MLGAPSSCTVGVLEIGVVGGLSVGWLLAVAVAGAESKPWSVATSDRRDEEAACAVALPGSSRSSSSGCSGSGSASVS